MAIKFDTLPTQNPGGGSVKPGLYYAHVEKAEMKQPKDASKKPYLSVTLKLFDRDKKKAGVLFDMFSESDNNVQQYKLGRFLRACGIPLVGEMELKDIAKVVINKDIAADVKEDEYNGHKRAAVNLFDNEAYYTADEYETVYAAIHTSDEDKAEANDGFSGMNVPENADATVPFDEETTASESSTDEY